MKIEVYGILSSGVWAKRHLSSRIVVNPDGLCPTILAGGGEE